MADNKERRSVAIEVTPRCNQKCAYCYNAWRGDGSGDGQELCLEKLVDLIDGILDDMQVGHFTLTGGEPFLREDIFDIIDYINGKYLPVAIISNGGKISPDVAKRLASRNIFYVQVTLTGHDSQAHDSLCGKGSFESTLTGISHLTTNGVKVGGSFLCTHNNYDHAFAVMELMKEIGATSHIAFNRFNPSGHAREVMNALMPTRSDVLIALEHVDRFAEREGTKIHCTMPIPHCMVDESRYPRVKFGQCSAGTRVSEYAVTAEGNLKMCTVHGLSLGNLFESRISELIDSEPVMQFRKSIPSFCSECPHREGCLGGCGAAARWVFGTDAELDPFIAQHVMVDYEEKLHKYACM